MGKRILIFPFDEILLSHKNEALTPATMWVNLENMILSEKPNSKEHILCDSICVECQESR